MEIRVRDLELILSETDEALVEHFDTYGHLAVPTADRLLHYARRLLDGDISFQQLDEEWEQWYPLVQGFVDAYECDDVAEVVVDEMGAANCLVDVGVAHEALHAVEVHAEPQEGGRVRVTPAVGVVLAGDAGAAGEVTDEVVEGANGEPARPTSIALSVRVGEQARRVRQGRAYFSEVVLQNVRQYVRKDDVALLAALPEYPESSLSHVDVVELGAHEFPST